MLRRVPADLLLLVATLIWSFHWPVIKYALDEGVEPLVYMAFRTVLGTMIFVAIALGAERSVWVARSDRRLLAFAGLVGIVAYQVAAVESVEHTTAATSALAFGTVPVFVVLFGRLAGTERLSSRVVAAAAVSFGGVALVAAGAKGEVSGDPVGIGLALVAAATWAAYSIALAPLMRRYSAWRVSAAVLLVGVIPLVAVAARQIARQDWTDLGALAWLALAYGLLLAFVLNTVLWLTAIDRVGPARSAIYANLQPFLGAVFALAVLSEELGPLQIAGGVVIGAGILLTRGRAGRAAEV